jgi:ABC-type nickel/cobalt efflux system permease component RcnA
MFKRSAFGLTHILGLAGFVALAGFGAYTIVRMRNPQKALAMKRTANKIVKKAKKQTNHAKTNHVNGTRAHAHA